MLTVANHNKFKKCTSNKSKYGNNFRARLRKKNWKIEQNIIFINLSITLELKRGKKRRLKVAKNKKENSYLMIFNH